MAGFDVGAFRSAISARGILKTNKFRVVIPIPPGLVGDDSTLIGRDLELYASAASLPGVDMLTSDVRRHGYGPVEKRAFGVNFGDVPIRFIADGEAEVWAFLQAWMNLTVPYDSSEGPVQSDSQVMTPHDVAYKDQYAVDLTIYIYDDYGNEAIIMNLLEAYPTRLEQVALDWNDTNSMMYINSLFTFRDWNATTINATSKTISNVLTKLIKKLF
jgi:hypothetical protein